MWKLKLVSLRIFKENFQCISLNQICFNTLYTYFLFAQQKLLLNDTCNLIADFMLKKYTNGKSTFAVSLDKMMDVV